MLLDGAESPKDKQKVKPSRKGRRSTIQLDKDKVPKDSMHYDRGTITVSRFSFDFHLEYF